MAIQIARRLFTTTEYDRMVEAGVLTKDDRVELIDGEILQMSPIGPRHAGCVNALARLFIQVLGDRAVVAIQNPVRLSERSEPQPDLSILRPRPDLYRSTHPAAEDVLLLVEVADSSAEYDRQLKLPLYARGAIPEVWLVNLDQQHFEIHLQPLSGGYGTVRVARRGETIHPQAFPDLTVAIDEVLG
jgi:Uma2 family endonuclease